MPRNLAGEAGSRSGLIIYMTLCQDIDLMRAAVQHSDIRLRPALGGCAARRAADRMGGITAT